MKWISIILLFTLIGQVSAKPLNNPYPKSDARANTLYSSFTERPKTLDPARSYSSNEYLFIGQIYEPPLQYHYLKRPFTLIPLTAVEIPQAEYFNKKNQKLPSDAKAKSVAYSIYTIHIKQGVFYQPHPALAKDKAGKFIYHKINEDYLDEHDVYQLIDFKQTGTRELTADDYVYQIKRLAHPKVHSPILGLMSETIIGLTQYTKTLKKAYDDKLKDGDDIAFLDLREYPLEGVKVIDKYTYQIKVKGKYPQFLYWLAMPFFSPIPWESDYFYQQDGMDDRNLTLDWFPIGTGPFMLTINNPNREMQMFKNPHFHGETYPSEGAPGDQEKGLLDDAGKPIPFLDKVIFRLEKEAIPRWTKFLQGYYDSSGIGSDNFDQAIQIDENGKVDLTGELQQRGLRLNTNVGSSIFYLGFNMLDDVVGGKTEHARKLRLAIALALDYGEFVSIFSNGRGIAAQGPIPPGIFGYTEGEEGINSYVFEWNGRKAKRQSLAKAKTLLAKAGYPNGRNEKTGQPLVLNYDVPASSGPDDKSRLDWMRKQFEKLGIQLNIRATQYNRFQEKMRTGNAQLFSWGWHADYPDPENFLFLLTCDNSKVKHGGENAANYCNKRFDVLFEQMKNMPNSPERLAIINKMVDIVRHDSPWVFGFHPINYVLSHQWTAVSKYNEIANNTLKYARLNPKLRERKRNEWNKPVFWPIIIFFGLLLVIIVPVVRRYREKQRGTR